MSYLTFEDPNTLKKTRKHFLAQNGEHWDLLLNDEELSARRKIVEAVDSRVRKPIDLLDDEERGQLESAAEIYCPLADAEFRTGVCAGAFVAYEYSDGERFVSVGALGTINVAQQNESAYFCTSYRVTPSSRSRTSSRSTRRAFVGRALNKLQRLADRLEDSEGRKRAEVSVTLPAGVCKSAKDDAGESDSVEQSTLSAKDFDRLRFLLSDYMLGLEIEAPYQQILDTLLQGAPPAPTERVELADANEQKFADLLSNLQDVSEPVGQNS